MIRATPLAALAVLPVVVGCASRAPAPELVDVTAVGSASAAPIASAPRNASAPVPTHPGASNPLAREIDVDTSAAAACTFGAPNGFDGGLAFVPGGKPFVDLHATGPVVARLALDGASFAVDVETEGVFFRGHASAESVPLYPQRPLLFSEFLAPRAHVAVDARPVRPDALLLAVNPLGDFDLAPTRPSVCADVGLEIAEFDARDAFPAMIRRGELRGAEIPMAKDRVGAFSVVLTPTDETAREVDVVGERGDRVEIVWDTGAYVLHGWVATASVEPTPDTGELNGLGGLGLSGVGEGGIPLVSVCPMDLALHAEVDGVSRVVGYVRRDTPFHPSGAARGGLVPIEFVGSLILVPAWSSLLVDEATAKRCPTR